jgi:hypothetical protein
MNRTHLCLAIISILLGGCGRAALTAPEHATTAARTEAAADTKTNSADAAALAGADGARKPGDFVVYRFSGSFRKTPLTLTEKVIAREGDAILLNVTADDGAQKRELKVKIGDAGEHKNEVLAVWKIENGKETASTVEAYEALLASTTLSADSNDAVLGSEDVKVAVGKDTVDAKRTSFRVRVGKRHGTLKTLESGAFAWGELGGEITTDGGKVLFKAEVVDAGHGDAPSTATAPTSVATDE